MSNASRIVIVGATSLIAQQCARLWLKGKLEELVLVARDAEKLDVVAKDLRVRAPETSILCLPSDFSNLCIQKIVTQIANQGNIDIVLIAHGFLSSQEKCQNDLGQCAEALTINGLSSVLFAEAFAKKMQQERAGTIAIIGSVAGDRSRKSNYVYGSAKALVSAYARGLQHRFANSDIRIVLIKPGPTDTPMTAHLKQNRRSLASPERVADDIVRGIRKRKLVVYTPKAWLFIMLIIRFLPSFIFNRLSV